MLTCSYFHDRSYPEALQMRIWNRFVMFWRRCLPADVLDRIVRVEGGLISKRPEADLEQTVYPGLNPLSGMFWTVVTVVSPALQRGERDYPITLWSPVGTALGHFICRDQ